jgi:cation:H+ antiporter
MTISILQLLMGGVLLFVGGEALVTGASRLALRMGISALAVGLTVVAFGTSMPELFVSLEAALNNKHDVALGNVVGSNICNIALILGLAALVKPVAINTRVVKLDLPVLILASAWLLYALLDLGVGRFDGAVCVLALLAYLVFNLREAGKESPGESGQSDQVSPPPSTTARNLLFIAFGLGSLALGADKFIDGSVSLAQLLGFSPAFIGLTIVALGTSLPELAVTVVAAKRGEGDIAVGNVVGSNIFNILGILGITALVQPLERGGIMGQDLVVMAGVTIALVPLLLVGPKLTRARGLLLLASYVSYIAWRLSVS